MIKPIYQMKDFMALSKRYNSAQEKFNSTTNEYKKQLSGELFDKINKQKRLIERKAEEQFLELWKSHGPIGYEFVKFKFDFDLEKTGKNNFYVIVMDTPMGEYNLEAIAKKYPQGQRNHDFLMENDRHYKLSSEKLKDELFSVGITDSKKLKEIRRYLLKKGINFPQAKYFNSH